MTDVYIAHLERIDKLLDNIDMRNNPKRNELILRAINEETWKARSELITK